MTQVSSLYLHIPFCQHLCNYCDFFKKTYDPASTQIEDFHQFLSKSWENHETLMKNVGYRWASLETLYLGGGTPSLWGIKGAKFLPTLLQNVKLKENCEFTMEVDPGTWNEELIGAWKEIGMNRISIGTQTLDPHFLKIMDRAHTLDESFALLDYCHKNDWNFSLDFLLGIPHSESDKRNIKKELDDLLAYKPKHISLYILNARSKYPLVDALPQDEYIREEYLFVSDYLKQNGFHHYEVSNFALPGFESLHNKKYWNSEAVASLGPTGTGYFPLSEDEALRYKWKVSGPEYEREKLTHKEIDLESTYLSLRTSAGWAYSSKFPSIECQIDSWCQQGLAERKGIKVVLTSLGFLMLDSLMDDLFRMEALESRK